jgi:phosphopantetheine--protein transferase-like protein
VILGLGIDSLETSRVEKELSRGNWLLDDGIFTAGEIRYCSAAGSPTIRYAACFVAKEATLKALGIKVSDLAMFREVEIEPGNDHGYEVTLHGRLKAESEKSGVQQIRLTISRNANQTVAVVVLED